MAAFDQSSDLQNAPVWREARQTCARQNRHLPHLIFETPAPAPFTDQVAAAIAVLDTSLASHHGFIVHAQLF